MTCSSWSLVHRRRVQSSSMNFAPVQDQDFAIGVCGSIGGPCQPVEQRNFSENLARTDKIENRTAAVNGGNAHFHCAAHHRKQAGSRISLGKERRTPLERGMSGVAAKLVKRLRLKVTKNRLLAQDR